LKLLLVIKYRVAAREPVRIPRCVNHNEATLPSPFLLLILSKPDVSYVTADWKFFFPPSSPDYHLCFSCCLVLFIYVCMYLYNFSFYLILIDVCSTRLWCICYYYFGLTPIDLTLSFKCNFPHRGFL